MTKNGGRFQSQIRINGKRKYIGTHGTAKEAALAFDRAVRPWSSGIASVYKITKMSLVNFHIT